MCKLTASGLLHQCVGVHVHECVCVCGLCVHLWMCTWHVQIHTDTYPPSLYYRQLNQEGEEYFSWHYFYDNLFRWLIWFRTLIYHQFIDLSLSLFLSSYLNYKDGMCEMELLGLLFCFSRNQCSSDNKKIYKINIYTEWEGKERDRDRENG